MKLRTQVLPSTWPSVAVATIAGLRDDLHSGVDEEAHDPIGVAPTRAQAR
jgi:hypothetical protein